LAETPENGPTVKRSARNGKDMFSWVAMDRFAEKERSRDGTFRKQNADKVLRSDATNLIDDDLLAKLRSFGIELDRPALERLCREALSAEEIATPLLDQRTFHGRLAEMESDWIWVCLTALWQRWFSDQPCFELPGRQDRGRI
jgi:hypothetical protein